MAAGVGQGFLHDPEGSQFHARIQPGHRAGHDEPGRLRGAARRKAGGYSLGMRQRLGIAAALVSSHLMSELQDTAGHLVVVGRGLVIADASVAELTAAASADRVTLRTAARDQALTVLARAGAEVATTGPDVLTISGLSAERIVALLAGAARSTRPRSASPGSTSGRPSWRSWR
jgi:ABC-2 type transport system ATP-binding protein